MHYHSNRFHVMMSSVATPADVCRAQCTAVVGPVEILCRPNGDIIPKQLRNVHVDNACVNSAAPR